MTKAAHTPGPWKHESGTVSVFAHGNKICDAAWTGKKVSEAEANARLIAAAPELLEASEDLDWAIGNGASDETWDAACAKARTAIAKAKGGNFNDPLKDKTVIVEVLGGVANIKACPPGVTVNIIDHDIARGTPENAEGSDSSDLLEAAEAVLAAWERGDLAAAVRWLDSAVGAAKGGGSMSTRPTLPPDPEGMNDRRADWGGAAIRHFQCTTGTDWEDAVADLLCDLMHFCDRENFDFQKELDRAHMHYQAETNPEGRQLMTNRNKLCQLRFAQTCIRHVIDATEDHQDLNHLAKIHLGITDVMDRTV